MMTDTLTQWDLTTLFPAHDAPERHTATLHAAECLDIAEAALAAALRERPQPAPEVVDQVLNSLNGAMDAVDRVDAYLRVLMQVDHRNHELRAVNGTFDPYRQRLRALNAEFTSWAASLDLPTVLAASRTAAQHEHALRRAALDARSRLDPQVAEVVADLTPFGGEAWWRHLQTTIARTTTRVALPDGEREASISELSRLAQGPNEEVREAALTAQRVALKAVGPVATAAVNAMFGQKLLLRRLRGFDEPLDAALHEDGLDREVLSAMWAAVEGASPRLQRYYAFKARLLGHGRQLPAADVTRPLPGCTKRLPYTEGVALVVDAFEQASPLLANLARRALREGWVDAGAREGKRPMSYCAATGGGTSRLSLVYYPGMASALTLAHELGHAYHNAVLAHRTPLQRQDPGRATTEMASLSAERLVIDHAVRSASVAERLAWLDFDVSRSLNFVFLYRTDFLFEQRVFNARRSRELTEEDLCEVSQQAFRDAYGEGVDVSGDPYRWVLRPQYMFPLRVFYNYQYTFGMLLSLSVARLGRDNFPMVFEELLSLTGMVDPPELLARFGLDLRSEAFWARGLSELEARLAELKAETLARSPWER